MLGTSSRIEVKVFTSTAFDIKDRRKLDRRVIRRAALYGFVVNRR